MEENGLGSRPLDWDLSSPLCVVVVLLQITGHAKVSNLVREGEEVEGCRHKEEGRGGVGMGGEGVRAEGTVRGKRTIMK